MNKITMAIVCFCLVACNHTKQKNETAELTINGDTIKIDASSPINKKIKTETVGTEPFSSEFRTVGTVSAISGKIAEIAAPFDGRVIKSNIQLGQHVGIGTPLLEINSSDFHEASKTYFQAKQNNDLAQKNYTRKKELLTGGVASKRDVEEAQTEAENTEAELKQAIANLKIFNVNPKSFSVGQALTITSPIAGEIVKSNIVIGQFVKSDGAPLATVADLSKVWVIAHVKEKYFSAIKKGDKVEIYTDAQPQKVVWGNIYHIGEMLDEETRSVEVLIECDNAQRELKPGMFTAVHFLNAPVESILIPETALLQTETESYVFIKIGEGRFVRRAVTTESAKDKKAHILSGLSVGETIIYDGGVYINE